ncbi:ASPIC/UnbV domain-containing protein [Maribacter litopenaei]
MDLDLFVSNGDLNPNCTPMGNFYFENQENKFVERGRELEVNDYGIGRGSVLFDMDNDGDQDLLVVNQIPILDYPIESATKLFRNDISNGNWLKVALKGMSSETSGIGSRVTVIANGKKLIREIDGGGSSHLSRNSVISHFGLGNSTKVDSIIVDWTGGNRQILLNQNVNQSLTITETEQSSFKWYVAIFITIVALMAWYILAKRKNPL